jgi:hypothetical protein
MAAPPCNQTLQVAKLGLSNPLWSMMDDVGCKRSGGLLAVSNRISRNLRSIFEIACRQRTIRKPFDLFVQVLLVERDTAVRLCVVIE